jgi:hypothetical protein
MREQPVAPIVVRIEKPNERGPRKRASFSFPGNLSVPRSMP